MIFQIIHQIGAQHIYFAGQINQRGGGKIEVQTKKADEIKRRDHQKSFLLNNADTGADPCHQHGEQRKLSRKVSEKGHGNFSEADLV